MMTATVATTMTATIATTMMIAITTMTIATTPITAAATTTGTKIKLKTLLPWLAFWLIIWSILTFRDQPGTLIIAVIVGVIGTLLIFATEMGYTYRKEGLLKWGKVGHWLRVHVIMGIAGPLIVLWHTGGDFFGFAGLLAVFTLVIVVSGFIGRYLYRLVPRSIKGQTLTLDELRQQAADLDSKLEDLRTHSPQTLEQFQTGSVQFAAPAPGHSKSGIEDAEAGAKVMSPLAFAQSEVEWRRQVRAFRANRRKRASHEGELVRQLRELHLERAWTERRIVVLNTSKTLLGRWKSIHIYMTVVLFGGIVIHVFSIIYYGRALP